MPGEDDPGVPSSVTVAVLPGWVWRRVQLVLLHAYAAAYAGRIGYVFLMCFHSGPGGGRRRWEGVGNARLDGEFFLKKSK